MLQVRLKSTMFGNNPKVVAVFSIVVGDVDQALERDYTTFKQVP